MAYVFYSADGITGWSEASKLLPSDGSAFAYFGASVSVFGSLVVVGAIFDDIDGNADAGLNIVATFIEYLIYLY